MRVDTAEIVISAVSPNQYPNSNLPEIALAGRSNVGKSSFINRLVGRKNLVRTSSVPGKTRTINFYLINETVHFVDVPGYGYAKVSKSEREKWGKMMEEYFETREALKAVVLIVDIRHGPTSDDLQMVEYIQHLEIPLIIVATKFDKISSSRRIKAVKQVHAAFPNDRQMTIIPFSAVTGENIQAAWKAIEQYM